ncbi:DoxX family protein [Diaphorobacter sp.]|uniref:DoxX family protein n=1 Tax=Diaphorobacter sp. TaxID=1934310 RepID=UPI0028A7188C|nr:DoxX family protein [Diaphorobacter sp.]
MNTSMGSLARASGADSALLLLGRLLLAWLFVPAGFSKIAGFAGTAAYVASKGMPMPNVMVVLAILAEVGCGLAILVGFRTRWAAWGLALFSVVAAFIFHAYWTMQGADAAGQQIHFNKNLGIAGGLLALSVAGAGAFSLDAAIGRGSTR